MINDIQPNKTKIKEYETRGELDAPLGCERNQEGQKAGSFRSNSSARMQEDAVLDGGDRRHRIQERIQALGFLSN